MFKDFQIDLKQYGLQLDDYQNKQFERYYEILIEGNEKTNLTGIVEKIDVYTKHFLDSIVICKYLNKNSSLIDIGTGAGFPSVPIKIVRPDIEICMVDSVLKKIDFLQTLNQSLQIKSELIHARAEDLAKTRREKYDYCVSRAVANMSTLCEYCLPFVKIGGYFIAYKSENIEEELQKSLSAIKILGGKIEKVEEMVLPNDAGKRKLIFIKKVSATPKIFPRGKNKPRIEPL